jgi:hypothetical protein
MTDISRLSRLVNGVQRQVDLSSNTLVVDQLKVGGGAGTNLTKTILDNLITLQNGSDISASLHHHDGRYFTETELGSSGASSGSDLIGDDNTYSNFTPAAATVKGALSGIDSALASGSGRVKVTTNDTTSDFLDSTLLVDIGTNSTNALEKSVVNPGANEQLRVRFDASKVDHGALTGLGDDDHTQYHNDARGDARYYQKSEFVTTSTAGAPVKLDGGGKIAVAQLPSAVMTYEGVWNASTNSPSLADGSGDAGMVYRVGTAGTQNLGSGSITFDVGDYVIYNGTIWEKSDTTDAVASVFGRTGIVTAQSGDYTASQVTNVPAGGIAATTVQAAINELDTEKFNSADFNSSFDTRLATKSTTDLAEGTNLYFTDERAQDAVGAALTDTATIDLTYNDGANTIAADVKTNSIDETHLTTSVAGAGLAGGNGTALSVTYAPSVRAAGEIAGESFAATTLFAVRYGQDAETAGRMYKADNDATSTDNFHVVGLVLTVGALSAAGSMPNIYKMGLMTVTSHGFTVGKPLWLGASGALTSTAPTASNIAAVKVGMVKDANTIDVQIQMMGVN